MQQLTLDVRLSQAPSFDNFVVGPNAELIAQLRSVVSGKRPAKCLFIWGEAGTGKSHLIAAMKQALSMRQALGQAVDTPSTDHAHDPAPAMLGSEVTLLEDCQNLDAQAQMVWFTSFISQAPNPQAMLIASANQAPRHLELRADFRTRLGSGLIFQLKRLEDDQKAEALRQHAASRQIGLPEELLRHLLRHYPRDIRSLMGMLENLDRFAFEQKRALSLPLLRDMERQTESASTQKIALPQARFKLD